MVTSACCEPISKSDAEKYSEIKYHMVSLLYCISGIMTGARLNEFSKIRQKK